MLREIRIQGLGVIDDAVLELADGLTVLTGETGAGKTMVVSALGLLLGERADAGRVRVGAGKAVVEGVVELDDGHPVVARAVEAGADVDDALILARTVQESGRSRAFVGGRSAPVGLLSELGRQLVAVHGQSDQWRLQRAEQHRVVLDEFAGEPVTSARTAYEQLFDSLQAARAELAELVTAQRDRAQRLDLLTRGLEEVEQVDPQPGEEVTLAEDAERLSHADELRAAAHTAQVALSGDEEQPDAAVSVLDLVSTARQAVSGLDEHDHRLGELGQRLAEIGVLAAELGTDLSSYLADVDADPARLDEINARRAQLTSLQRKYGDTVADVLEWSRSAAAEAAELSGTDDRIEMLQQVVADTGPRLTAAAQELTAARRAAADELSRRVQDELAHLAMGGATVQVDVRQTEADQGVELADGRTVRAARHGVDEVEIMLATGSGGTPRTVARAASGGELSRVMLALEVVTADGEVPTFVFDEVDAGIGGAVALDVGSRLQSLASRAQVVVVTHLAQVAAYADRHLVVRKTDDGQVTASGVVEVTGAERESELARMLGGHADSEAALEHARELLDGARRDSGAEGRRRGRRQG